MNAGALHAVAWLIWAIGAAISVELAPSPVYVVIVIAVAGVVVAAHGTGSALARAFPLFLAVGGGFAILRVVLTGLTTHTDGSVLVTLPDFRLPALLGGFTVGGPIHAEVVLGAAAESLVVVGVMAVFGAFNAVVAHHQLVQAAPRAFYESGLVLTVSLAFVPSIIGTIQRVREADRARLGGARPPRRRNFSLIVPVLEASLERAVALAESMDSRGFGRSGAGRYARAGVGLALAGLLLIGAAFVALVAAQPGGAVATAVPGLIAVMAGIAVTSAGDRRPRYRRRPLAGPDVVVMGLSLAAPVILGVLAAGGGAGLSWTAGAGWPAVTPAAVIALLLLAAPAAVGGRTAPAPSGRVAVVSS